MRGCVAVVVFLACGLAVSAGSLRNMRTPDLTVVLKFDQTHTPASLGALKSELQNVLGRSGVRVHVRVRKDFSSQDRARQLVFFRMKGHCGIDPDFAAPPLRDGEPLARTYLSDGEVLQMGEVECDRVWSSVEDALQNGDPVEKQAEFGTALARVMAHEIYHMITSSRDHSLHGIEKERLSPRDLLSPKMAFSEVAAANLRRHLYQP